MSKKSNSNPSGKDSASPVQIGRFRGALKVFGLLAGLFGILFIIGAILLTSGPGEEYVKNRFTAKLNRMGIDFQSRDFSIDLNPLTLNINDARFINAVNKQPILSIEKATVGLSVGDLFSLRMSRDISVESVDIEGAQIDVSVNPDGTTNFSGVRMVEEEDAVRVVFESARVSIRNSVVRYGDVNRKISANANDLSLGVTPTDKTTPTGEKEYQFELKTVGSDLTYDTRTLSDITVTGAGTVSASGARIDRLTVDSKTGAAEIKGSTAGWSTPRFDLTIDGRLDLADISRVLGASTPFTGTGKFSGTISGVGEGFKIDGTVVADSIVVEGISITGLDIGAALEGRSSSYEANGKALAQLLTAGDFSISQPQLSGVISGSGDVFKWLGGLQAAAVTTGNGSIGRLIISEAVAERETGRFNTKLGRLAMGNYTRNGLQIDDIRTEGLGIENVSGTTKIQSQDVRAARLRTEAVTLKNLRSAPLTIRDSKNGLSIFTELLQSDSGSIGTFGLGRVFARNVDIFDRGGVTEINAAELATESFKTEGLDFGNVSAMGLKIIDTPSQLLATPSKLTLGRFDTDVIVLGEMNLNGVRFAITQKTIEMSADDVEAGPGYIPANSIFARGGDVSGVRFTKPKLVVMPSGTYRVTADIGLGGGVVGNMNLGSARGSIEVTKDFTTISDIEAEVMNGRASGKLTVASGAGESQLKMNFEGVDAARLLTLQGGKVIPFSGIAKGSVDLRFPGDDPRNVSGDIVADILPGNVDKNDSIKGKIVVKATSGLFEVSSTSLETAKTSLSASGRFDLKNDRSNLAVKLSSTDADEVSVILRSFDLAKDIQTRLDGFGLSFNGRMKFTGGLRGNIFDPMVSADFELGNLGVKGQALGGLSAKIERDENGFRILDGLLSEADGGRFSFGMVVPSRGDNNISIAGKLMRINTWSLLAVAPVDLPRGIRSLSGDTSGEINLSGLPSQMSGYVSLNGEKVSLSDEIIESFSLQSRFVGSKVLIDNLTLRFDGGFANITGDIDTVSKNIGFKFVGNGVPLSQLSGLAENPTNFPKLSGVGEMSGEVSGVTDDLKSLIISFTGNGRGVGINGESFGDLAVSGATRGGLLSIKVDNLRQEKGQLIDATVDLGRDGLPFTADVLLKDASLNPYISLFKPNTSASISGRASGRISAAGMLTGNEGVAFSPSISSGNAAFTVFEIQIDETPLVATEPIAIKLTPDAVTFERANFAGGGSNVRISGTKAFSGDADNDFSVVGKVNLSLFNAFVKDTFFSGIADLNVRINGPNDTAKLNGRAEMLSSSLSTFVSGQRVSLERVKGTVIFTSSQAQIQNATGVIGGGKVSISGGARLDQNLELDALKLDLRGENVSVPLPKNFLTTGDVNLSISSRRSAGKLSSFVSGRIGARRSIYATKIDLADVIGKRRDSALASSSTTTTSGFGDVTFDVLIEGRDALIVRNNLADLTASLSLRVTGDLNKPVIAGRIVASSGTLFFRSERYEIQRAELIFPPNTSLEPIVNLQAEADIKGYQILVNLSGGLSDIDALNATVRSNPTLPQADVISLITTGNLANAESGIPSSTQTGLSAAADILTDEIISKPISKATDRLFGLNRFEVDPILSGQRLNPTARLTVGRQINRNLLVSYSTNLAQDQNQIVALEYRLSNRLSFVAQYEQRSLSNVTQKANSFSFEIRLRKRF